MAGEGVCVVCVCVCVFMAGGSAWLEGGMYGRGCAWLICSKTVLSEPPSTANLGEGVQNLVLLGPITSFQWEYIE